MNGEKQEKKQQKGLTYHLLGCGEKSNREDFANFQDMEEISFEEMLELERNYQ